MMPAKFSSQTHLRYRSKMSASSTSCTRTYSPALRWPMHDNFWSLGVRRSGKKCTRERQSRDRALRPGGRPATFPGAWCHSSHTEWERRLGGAIAHHTRQPPLSHASSPKGSDSYQESGPHTVQFGHPGPGGAEPPASHDADTASDSDPKAARPYPIPRQAASCCRWTSRRC